MLVIIFKKLKINVEINNKINNKINDKININLKNINLN